MSLNRPGLAAHDLHSKPSQAKLRDLHTPNLSLTNCSPKSSRRPQVFHSRSNSAAQNQGSYGLDSPHLPTFARVQASEQRDMGLSCRGRPAPHEPARIPSPRRCRDRRGCMEPQGAAGVLTIARGLRTARLRMHLPLRLRLRVRCAAVYARTSRLAAGAARAAGAPRPEGGARSEPIQKCGGCGPRRNSQSGA